MKMKWFLTAMVALIGIGLVITSNLFVSVPDFKSVTRGPIDGPFRLAAQTKIDGVFKSVTSRENINDASVDWQNALPAGTQAKRVASYPWSTASYGKDVLWMCTISQGWCVWPAVNLKWPYMLTTYQSQYTGCSVQDILASPSQVVVFNFETGAQELVNEAWLKHG